MPEYDFEIVFEKMKDLTDKNPKMLGTSSSQGEVETTLLRTKEFRELARLANALTQPRPGYTSGT